jgi:hypothetical protein
MDASYFYFIVLPLGVFVFLLTALAYYYARKEEIAHRNWKRLLDAYTNKQPGQGENTGTDDYYDMKLEKALEQLNVATSRDKLDKEEEDVMETRCSEEDVSYNVT